MFVLIGRLLLFLVLACVLATGCGKKKDAVHRIGGEAEDSFRLSDVAPGVILFGNRGRPILWDEIHSYLDPDSTGLTFPDTLGASMQWYGPDGPCRLVLWFHNVGQEDWYQELRCYREVDGREVQIYEPPGARRSRMLQMRLDPDLPDGGQ